MILAFRAVNKEIIVPAEIDVHARFDCVASNDLREIVRELVTFVCVRQLEAISSEYESCIRILDDNCRRSRWRGRQIKVIIAAKVEAKFVDAPRSKGSLERNLKEVTGCTVSQRQTIACRRGSVEVSVGTAKTLIVVGDIN